MREQSETIAERFVPFVLRGREKEEKEKESVYSE